MISLDIVCDDCDAKARATLVRIPLQVDLPPDWWVRLADTGREGHHCPPCGQVRHAADMERCGHRFTCLPVTVGPGRQEVTLSFGLDVPPRIRAYRVELSALTPDTVTPWNLYGIRSPGGPNLLLVDDRHAWVAHLDESVLLRPCGHATAAGLHLDVEAPADLPEETPLTVTFVGETVQ